jgi:hypothetical protein
MSKLFSLLASEGIFFYISIFKLHVIWEERNKLVLGGSTPAQVNCRGKQHGTSTAKHATV